MSSRGFGKVAHGVHLCGDHGFWHVGGSLDGSVISRRGDFLWSPAPIGGGVGESC